MKVTCKDQRSRVQIQCWIGQPAMNMDDTTKARTAWSRQRLPCKTVLPNRCGGLPRGAFEERVEVGCDSEDAIVEIAREPKNGAMLVQMGIGGNRKKRRHCADHRLWISKSAAKGAEHFLEALAIIGSLLRGIHFDAEPLIGPVDQKLEVRELGRADARSAKKNDFASHKCIN